MEITAVRWTYRKFVPTKDVASAAYGRENIMVRSLMYNAKNKIIHINQEPSAPIPIIEEYFTLEEFKQLNIDCCDMITFSKLITCPDNRISHVDSEFLIVERIPVSNHRGRSTIRIELELLINFLQEYRLNDTLLLALII